MKKKLVKEGWYKGELLKNAIGYAKKARSLLDSAAEDCRAIFGEEDYLFARLDSSSNDVDETIDSMQRTLESLSEEEYGELVSESEEILPTGAWSENGEYKKPIPASCIEDCAGPGQKDNEVAMWVEELGFANGMPIEKAKNYIEEYGAWDREELDAKSDEEIAQIVLWLFCGNVHEEAYLFMRDENKDDYPELGNLPEDIADWTDQDWEVFQNAYCSLSLNN